MDGQSRGSVGADVLKMDGAILNCSMYWGAIVRLWLTGRCAASVASVWLSLLAVLGRFQLFPSIGLFRKIPL